MAPKNTSTTINTENSFKCTVKDCNATFSNSSKLTFHIRKHTGERPYKCDEDGCDKTYTNSSHLRRHKNVSHGEKETQQIMCDVDGCGLVLANKYSLKKHQNRKHNLENFSFICHDCGQGYHRKRQLQQHIYVHTGEAPFKCDKCEIGFTSNTDLNKHKRRHKIYTCDCGERFHRWSLILVHKKTCQQPRFKCDVCNKIFSHSGNFKNHQLTHFDNKDKDVYVCPYKDCERFYFYRKNLSFHLNKYHEKTIDNRKFPCTYSNCKLVLKTKQSLKQHLQRHAKRTKSKERKVRRDKGQAKKSMVSVLTGVDDTLMEDVSDDILLEQCDLVLSQLQEKISLQNNCN